MWLLVCWSSHAPFVSVLRCQATGPGSWGSARVRRGQSADADNTGPCGSERAGPASGRINGSTRGREGRHANPALHLGDGASTPTQGAVYGLNQGSAAVCASANSRTKPSAQATAASTADSRPALAPKRDPHKAPSPSGTGGDVATQSTVRPPDSRSLNTLRTTSAVTGSSRPCSAFR